MQQSKVTTPTRQTCLSSMNRNQIPNSLVKSQQVRNRYLQTLGIKNLSTEISAATRFQSSRNSSMRPVRTLKEPLKGDDRKYQRKHQPISTSYSPQSVMSSINVRTVMKRQVSFDNSVSVVPIPKRDAYSYRIKNRIWNSAIEIHENAHRNAVEFSAENWDWRQVREEEEFLICVDTGEKVHPVHASFYQEVEEFSCGPSKHKDSFLEMSRENANEWQMRERQVHS